MVHVVEVAESNSYSDGRQPCAVLRLLIEPSHDNLQAEI